ncbi:MAG: hypothetical protein ABIH70_04970 [Chloroflexota bacterium]
MSVEDTLNALKKQMEDHEKRISKLESKSQTEPSSSPKKMSLKEFLLSKKPKSGIHKTLVIGYYLEKHESVSPFNVSDLENGFRSAKEPFPKNIHLAVFYNIKKGYMMEDKEKKDKAKALVLTNTGEQLVEGGFVEK